MTVHATSDIRNLAFVGHGHSGKTSLVEAILFASGATSRLGSTDAGTTVTDFGDDEHHRKTSIRLGLAHAEHGRVKLNLVDTPGFGNFLNDARVGLSICDLAVVLVDAHSGVEVQTERVWAYAQDFDLPRVLVLNKLDRENTPFESAVSSVAERFGRGTVPVQVPIGEEGALRGVVDLVSLQAWTWKADGTAACEVGAAPAAMKPLIERHRQNLLEMVAESDEALMERFLETGTLGETEFRDGLRRAVQAGLLHPIACTAATKMVGIQALMDLLVELAPAPDARPARVGKDGAVRQPQDDEPVALQVFKTLHDPFAGRLSLFRLESGVLKPDMALHNARTDGEERCAALSLVQGKDLAKAAELHPGDLGCLAKLKDTLTGDTLHAKGQAIDYEHLSVPEPMMSFAIEGKNPGDDEKITSALHKAAEEDLVLRYRLDPQTKELVVSGAGEGHVEAVVERLRARTRLEIVLHPPRVPYRETITRPASGSYRHKKQSGGAGQFADVHMEIKPLPRGGGFEYDTDRIKGGAISANFFPSIEKGIRQVLERGALAGNPVVDVRCEVFDGKMHAVDSKDIAFQTAGRQLMKQLMLEAAPILLEPVMRVAVSVPEESMGDVMGDLSSRRGRVQGMEMEGTRQVIRALVPLAETLSYQAQLKSITAGRGDFTMELDHYDIVPPHLQEKIVAAARKGDDHDVEN